MTRNAHLRIARPTNMLRRIANMYVRGLGLGKIGAFEDHEGFSGEMLGHPDQDWHLEFTQEAGIKAPCCPSPEHLLVFYVAEVSEQERVCARMKEAGFIEVTPHNPYWANCGRTFEDLEGYRVVVQNAAWTRA